MEFFEKQSFARQRCLAQGEGDAIREYEAVHEENFFGSWFREDWNSKTKEDKGEGIKEKKRQGERIR